MRCHHGLRGVVASVTKNRRQHTPATVVAPEGHTTPMVRTRSRSRLLACAGSPVDAKLASQASLIRCGGNATRHDSFTTFLGNSGRLYYTSVIEANHFAGGTTAPPRSPLSVRESSDRSSDSPAKISAAWSDPLLDGILAMRDEGPERAHGSGPGDCSHPAGSADRVTGHGKRRDWRPALPG